MNTTAMGGWRLSATGTLIPPPDLLTSGLPNAAVQKRGSERLFQYLEADGSDTEDYTRYFLKKLFNLYSIFSPLPSFSVSIANNFSFTCLIL